MHYKIIYYINIIAISYAYNIDSSNPKRIYNLVNEGLNEGWCGFDFDVSNENIVIGCPKVSKVFECDFNGYCDEIVLNNKIPSFQSHDRNGSPNNNTHKSANV